MMRNLILAMLLMPSLAWGADPILPNPTMTPGEVIPGVSLDKVCTVGYTKTVRYVPQSKKDHVYELYGITKVPHQFEIDHLISLELGGSNSMRNLWPQSYSGIWGARIKDALENRLHDLVCMGKADLRTAQYEISHNWIQAYCKYMSNTDNCRGVNIE